ncbi:MAG: hypothetical protein IK078_09805, partial [Lachnospiraceae bacterium]|nr:hypothetical protein [Lachnospiraceae bacterium]
MDRTKIILIGVITFSIVILLGGLFWYLLWGSVNFFGEQGFHGEASAFFSGVVGAAFIFAPIITSIVYRLMKHKKQALIMLICAIICWILFFVVFPLLGKLSDNIRNSAPPEKIAMRAIQRTDKDLKKEGTVMPSDVYAERVGSRLWIFEGTATELDPVKEKEVVEKAAEMVFEKAKNEVSPSFSRYGWRTIYY